MIFEWNKFHSRLACIPHASKTLMSLVAVQTMSFSYLCVQVSASGREWSFNCTTVAILAGVRRSRNANEKAIITETQTGLQAKRAQASSFIKCDWLIFVAVVFVVCQRKISYVNANNVIMRLKPTHTHTQRQRHQATLFSQGFSNDCLLYLLYSLMRTISGIAWKCFSMSGSLLLFFFCSCGCCCFCRYFAPKKKKYGANVWKEEPIWGARRNEEKPHKIFVWHMSE